MGSEKGTDVATPRRRGRPPQISRGAVLAAARELAPEELSVQAVADRLGVARRSVGHYVSGVDELRRLVAAADLVDGLAAVELPHGDWKAAIAHYAGAVRDVLVRNPTAATVLTEIPLVGPLALVDHLVAELLDAGLDAGTVARAIELINDVSLASARRITASRQFGEYPLASDALVVVEQVADRLTQLRELFATGAAQAASLDDFFALDVVVTGLERIISSRD